MNKFTNQTKSRLKKTLSIFMTLSLLILSLVSCTDSNTSESTLRVGILQYAPHPSLDNCYQGVLAGLEEKGYIEGKNLTIDYQNGQGEPSTTNGIAKNMVSKNYDMIIAIATPAATAAYAAAKDTDIPVVYVAVADPIAAKLADTLESPGLNCTGTADVLDLEKQLAMIRAFQPDAKTIGILYTTGEANSISNLERFKTLAPEYGFQVEATGIQNASDIPAAAADLVKKVDCINNFTDNNVVNNLSVLLQKAQEADIPVYGSEIEQVANGCLASQSIDYVAVGKISGEMAADVLNGADASQMAVRTVSECTPVYNSKTLSERGLTLPAEYADAEDAA